MAKGKGYDGYSMSINALESYEAGEKPWSKWSKKDLIEIVEKISTKNFVDILKKTKLELLKAALLTYRGWHHTSCKYNETEFWGFIWSDEETGEIEPFDSEEEELILQAIESNDPSKNFARYRRDY